MRHWREVASFKTEQEWRSSVYYGRVTDESVQEMIDWFWHDLYEDAEKAKAQVSV
ncbi:MAG: hypothetical protein KBC81_01585 [Candidatus Pacebacteria bacterium]|nr:hypothetical protein [Candidatus Paceibacterota bacterium]